jgi:hypothetical protein
MTPAKAATGPRDASGDLDLVEQLIDRARRELEGAELNVKLADLVRLLEFKSKLQPAVDAERAFWSMIDQMRREELPDYGRTVDAPIDEVSADDTD